MAEIDVPTQRLVLSLARELTAAGTRAFITARFSSRMSSPKPTILLIDDDPTMRKVYTVALAMAGLPTHIVSSAEEAAKILENHKIDVIVTDLMMPTFNGVDIIKAVRETDYTKHIPVLVFTSGGNMDLVEQAALAGATDIMQKHSTPPAKLIERIQKAYAERR